VNYLDVGAAFGMPTFDVFKKTSLKLLEPQSAGDLVRMLDDADVIGFGGGADIHPSLYGCKDVGSSVGHGPSTRDRTERQVFDYAVQHGIPMFGICRGAQLLCALSGGKLVQDVQGHGGTHTITTHGGLMMPMSSTHHQMMYPWDVPHDLIAWTENKSDRYIHDIPNYVQPDKDPEVVFFEHTGALAVQGHPEWMEYDSGTVRQVRIWAREYLNLNI
jgi:putative glutamine amidotransferase